MLFFAGLIVSSPAIMLPAGRPGFAEAGQPPFSILNTEQLGLNSVPRNIRLMPDGRLLVTAGRQLALGDGVRWEVFPQVAEQLEAADMGAEVDKDGAIYLPTLEGVGRVDFGGNGAWRLVPITAWPSQETASEIPTSRTTEPLWAWHTLTGPVYGWRPGQPARLWATGNTIECLFQMDGAYFLSERGNGRLMRLGAAQPEVVREGGSFSAITCVLPLGPGRMLAGTYGLGLKLFDGRSLLPFTDDPLFSTGVRINDLCVAGAGRFAAAVDNFGLVFFDQDGRVLQTLDQRADQRLARVRRLVATPDGVIWGLLDGGVVRLEYPTALSRFESLLGAGLTTVHPFRMGGLLWFLSDGRVYRGRYSPSHRLEKLDEDSPPDRFVNSLAQVEETPVAGTEEGAFYRAAEGWVGFAPALKNFRIISERPANGRWLYTARDEIGWVEQTPEKGLRLGERFPVAGLSNVYNRPVHDGSGRIWLELGSARIGLVEIVAGRPQVTLFEQADGVPGSWPQTFELNGVVGFDFSGELHSFDETSRRIVRGGRWLGGLPVDSGIFGRPGIDAQGRLWIVVAGQVQVWQKRNGEWQQMPWAVHPGFQPYYFVFEESGVVWMHTQHRFARFDPNVVAPARAPLEAMITRVTQGDRQHLMTAAIGELPAVPFEENALQAHFVAKGGTQNLPVSFDVKLEGTGRDWTDIGPAGLVRFEQLREGQYRLRVRPRAGEQFGREAALGVTILPPWYRTTLAYVSFGAGVVLVSGLFGWLLTWLLRKDRSRLENLVRERTLELQRSNEQLGWRVAEIRLLSEAIEQSPVAVFVTRPDDVIEYANASAGSLGSGTAASLIGRTLRSLRGDATSAAVLDERAAAIRRGQAWSGQLANRHPDGRIVHVRSTCTPLRGPDGQVQHFVVLEEDITLRLAEDERRRRLEDQLLQSQKMETIGQLAGGVAHDLNNMLQAITGFATVAQQADVSQRERDDSLREILGAARRATEVTRQLLLFGRQQQVELKPVDVALLMTNLLRLLRRLISENIVIEFPAPPAPVFALCDSTQIEQVLINLCVNARDAMPKGGTINLSVASRVLDEDFVGSNPWARAGDFVEITVRDNGTGMDQAVMARIFEPFFSTKPKEKGTGLGLSVVYGIVIQHKGLIRVNSQPGQGAEFLIYLPATAAAAPAVVTEEIVPDRGSETILVAEDDPSVRSLADRVLRRAGYRVLLATDGEEAVDIFHRHRDEISLLVFDCVMPRTGGFEAYQRLGTTLPVIFCTGYSEEVVMSDFALPPNGRILQKPYELSALLQAVRKSLDAAVSR